MAPGRKRVPTPAAGVQPPPSGARGDGENANPGTGGALQMGCAVGGHHPMRRPRPDEFSENCEDGLLVVKGSNLASGMTPSQES